MDALYDSGIHFILYLQKSWSGWENEMLWLSKFGDPRNAFLVYFPIVYSWSAELGISLLWTAVISEWYNLVLKWQLNGDRPYWWVHESSKWKNVTLKQYELTCETGPGSPSGHVMVTSAVFCLLTLWLLNALKENSFCKLHLWRRLFITVAVWILLFVILAFVSISRVFIATHFPHQVFLGAIIGLIVATVVNNRGSTLIGISHSAPFCVIFSLGVVLTTLLTYFTLSAFVHDPSTSVAKAQKWCIKSSYVHLDTTTFYALVRDCGVTAGIGISQSLLSSFTRKFNERPNDSKTARASLFTRNFRLTLSIILLHLLKVVPLPNSYYSVLFYAAGYVKCSFIPIIVIFIVPNIVT